MQPVHNQHDRTRELVVEPAVKGVVVPLIGRWACDNASSGFSGSSIIMMSAPRPVSTLPTEVVMRKPCAVVSNSR